MTRALQGTAPIVLSAPSGTGKTTVARHLVDEAEGFVFSISATTRSPRPGERRGVDYDFVSEAAFLAMLRAGELAEWARVHGRWYGTPVANLVTASEGARVLLDIDVQGARQIKAALPDALLVFLLPPSLEILKSRLRGRGTEDARELERRLASALSELDAAPEFDFFIVNEDVIECGAELRRIAQGGTGARWADVVERVSKLKTGIRALLDEHEDSDERTETE